MSALPNTLLRLKALPEDVKLGLLTLISLPVLFAMLALFNMFFPVITIEIIPGAFYETGDIKASKLFSALCILTALYFGLIKGGQHGGLGVMSTSTVYALLFYYI